MSREKREEKAKAGIAKGKERAERANKAADDLEAKAKRHGHTGEKFTRKEIKELKEKEKNV